LKVRGVTRDRPMPQAALFPISTNSLADLAN
jgi:hypothetical protein